MNAEKNRKIAEILKEVQHFEREVGYLQTLLAENALVRIQLEKELTEAKESLETSLISLQNTKDEPEPEISPEFKFGDLLKICFIEDLIAPVSSDKWKLYVVTWFNGWYTKFVGTDGVEHQLTREQFSKLWRAGRVVSSTEELFANIEVY